LKQGNKHKHFISIGVDEGVGEFECIPCVHEHLWTSIKKVASRDSARGCEKITEVLSGRKYMVLKYFFSLLEIDFVFDENQEKIVVDHGLQLEVGVKKKSVHILRKHTERKNEGVVWCGTRASLSYRQCSAM
jgi:hypothetical protein